MSDRTLQTAFDSLGVGVAQLALDGGWLMANRCLCEMLGYSREQLQAQAFDHFFRARESATEDAERGRLLTGAIPSYASERSAVRKDGSQLSVRIVFSMLRTEDDTEPPCILAAIENFTALRSAMTSLREANTARREVARRLTNAQENERTRIARELHDDIGQSLAVLRVQMLRAGEPISDLPGKRHASITELSDNLNLIAEKVSRLSHQLHSSALQYLGLKSAVNGHCREFSQQFKIAVDCSCVDLPANLDGLLALSVLRVVQEALHNAGKHSHAKAIQVTLRASATNLSLEIVDNGVGFDVEEKRLAAGLGLISMRERIHLAGGEFTVWSRPGEGTRITAQVPLPENSQAPPSE